MGRVRGDPGEDVRQPGLRIDVVHLRRDDEAVHGGRALATSVRRYVMMPGIWVVRLRFSIRSIRFTVRRRWLLAINCMMADAI
jgi:hypothetical protein